MATDPRTADQNLDRLRRAAVLAVLRAPSADAALRASEALVAGGVTGLEITYSTPDVAMVISTLAERYGGDVYLGAGTVTTADQAREAASAGAEFLVSPGTVPDLVSAMQATGRTVMTGALTPTEVMVATGLNVDVIKIFPASLGGPGFLKSLKGPFPDAVLMPTGGVTPANLADWFAAGAVAVGAGSDLVSARDLATADWPAITANAQAFVAALSAARG